VTRVGIAPVATPNSRFTRESGNRKPVSGAWQLEQGLPRRVRERPVLEDQPTDVDELRAAGDGVGVDVRTILGARSRRERGGEQG
jgi:hypothetical protein